MSDSPPLPYCCPGETQAISRAVHLGRLASFYPACRECPHADDTRTLSPRHVRQLQATQRRARPASLFHGEGMAGAFLNELGPAEAGRAAAALAAIVAQEVEADAPLEMIFGCDGRPMAAEIGAAACDALRVAGCTVHDAGFTTAGAVAHAVGRLHCAGGLYVGRGDGGAQHINLSFFGQQAIPLSVGGGLDALAELWHAGVERTGRRPGAVRRQRIDAALTNELSAHFHALRPLRLVLDTTSLPLKQQLARLASRVSLEILATPAATDAGDRVRQAGAHFGLWGDGDGVGCRLIDERGDLVPSSRVAMLLFRYFCQQDAAAVVVVEEEAEDAARAALGPEAQIHAAPNTREAMARAMQAHGATAGGGGSDAHWFAAPTPVACALRTLTTLLTIFSRSDRPVSEVCHE